MKALFFCSLFFIGLNVFSKGHHTLNPVIGNQSQMIHFIYLPGIEISETAKIASHLIYAELLLRSKDVSHLSATEIEKREIVLNHLHTYILNMQFPSNTKYQNQRAPCFLDENGNVCAVGYLVQETAGFESVLAINETYQYADISEMDQKTIEDWAIENGLTLEECALIQPTYDWVKPYEKSIHLEAVATLKPSAQFIWGMQLMRYRQHWGSKIFNLTAYGIQTKFLKNQDFAVGIRGLAAFSGMRYLRPYVALNSEYFVVKSRGNGINVAPELGLSSQFTLKNKWIANAYLGYGYQLALSGKENYGLNRHDLSLGIGIGYRW